NADLTNLTINHNATFTPIFAPGQVSYTASVPYSTNEISLTPACDTTATVKVNNIAVSSGTKSQKFPLNIGDNVLTTVVKAEDGITTKTYTVMVTRAASPNAYLANLKINGGAIALSPAFHYSTNAYMASVSTSTIRVTAVAADPGASITINSVPATSGTASAPITLNTGGNTITTVVTAADGISTLTYTITVTRAPSNNTDLTNLKIDNGSIALSPSFNYNITSYTASVS